MESVDEIIIWVVGVKNDSICSFRTQLLIIEGCMLIGIHGNCCFLLTVEAGGLSPQFTCVLPPPSRRASCWLTLSGAEGRNQNQCESYSFTWLSLGRIRRRPFFLNFMLPPKAMKTLIIPKGCSSHSSLIKVLYGCDGSAVMVLMGWRILKWTNEWKLYGYY